MLFLRKLLKLPSPIDLGWSKYNALECEDFSDEPRGKTWEDWHKTVKTMHPIKYWFAETFGDFVRYKVWLPFTKPFETARYWLVSHLIPSRRYHMLDLRQKGAYQYGWCDVPEKMLYAIFNILNQFVDQELPNYYCPSEEEILKVSEEDAFILQRQRDLVFEIMNIHYWWNTGRHEELAHKDEIQDKWWNAKKKNLPNKEKYWEQLNQMDIDFENKTNEMIARLMKIRGSLWT